MPRIHNTGPLVTEWYERVGEGSGTADVCRSCWNEILDDPTIYQRELGEGNCPNGDPSQFWLDVGEPPESFQDLDYNCDTCGSRLYWKDDQNDTDHDRSRVALAKAIKDWEAEVIDIPDTIPLTELDRFFN